jgi:hypothetical protein
LKRLFGAVVAGLPLAPAIGDYLVFTPSVSALTGRSIVHRRQAH